MLQPRPVCIKGRVNDSLWQEREARKRRVLDCLPNTSLNHGRIREYFM